MNLPDLSLAGWRGTRDTLHAYVKVLGKVRGALAPRAKHWSHVSLRVAAAGLTTAPVAADDRVMELLLNLRDHRLDVHTNRDRRTLSLQGQSAAEVCGAALDALADLGIPAPIERAAFAATATGQYDRAAVARFWQALPLIDAVLQRLKAEHRGESGPVQFWPHGFDLAVLLFTGRQVPGVDPADEESADEQMNFGFSTGDDGIPEPYFYATAYPSPAGMTSGTLPKGAHWHTEDWTGAILRYGDLRAADRPLERLLDFFRTARDIGLRSLRR